MKDNRCLRDILGFNDIWVMVFGIPVIGFLVPLLFFGDDLSDGFSNYVPHWTLSTLYTLGYWVVTRGIIIWKRRRFPAQADTAKRIVVSILVFIPFYLVFHNLMQGTHAYFQDATNPEVSDWQYHAASLLMIIMVAAIYESVYLYSRWKLSLIEQEKLKREYIQSQLEGLKNQVNPHFLFNSLNTLIYLIPEDPQRAVAFVQKLAKVYRYVLDIQDNQLIPLESELTFLESFIYLLKERFGDSLQVEISIPDERREAGVVPLALQLLVENAIKHNIVSASQPLRLKISIENGKLTVVNNLQKRQSAQPSTQVGLINIRNRYAFFTEEMVDIAETPAVFRVALPLLPAPVGG